MAQVYHTTHHPEAKPIYKGTQFVWFLYWLTAAFLAFRFFLRLVGANSQAGFTKFIYDVSAPLIAPFTGVLRPAQSGASAVEWSPILALVVYYLVAWAITRLLFISKPVSTPEAEHKLEREN